MRRHFCLSLFLLIFIFPSAVNSQLSAVRGYEGAAATVRAKSRVPLRLPTQIPNASELYAIVESADVDGYEIQLALTQDCLGGNACHAGYITGSSKPLPKENRRLRPITLNHGIKGVFIASSCGAHCDDSVLYWKQDGYYYVIGLKAGKESALISLANSTITSEQTHFGVEDQFERPVVLPTGALRTLRASKEKNDLLQECAKQEGIEPDEIPASWFVASNIRLSSNSTAFVVRGETRCLAGAHSTRFWVLTKSEKGVYRIVFRGRGDGFLVLSTRTNGYRDLELLIVTQAGANVDAVKFRYFRAFYRVSGHHMTHN